MLKMLSGGALLLAGAAGAVPPHKSPAHAVPAKSAAPAPKAASLPAFTFKEARAGETMDPAAVGKCSPSDDGIAGKLECRGSDPTVAGINLSLAPSYYFFQNRLTTMLFLYDNDGTNFLTLLGAFRDKYGAPCNSGTEKWQNKAGSSFDNTTATWCFKTGKLKLEQLGPSLKYGVATYDDEFSSPSKATPKDF